jgi:hypothetical protein
MNSVRVYVSAHKLSVNKLAAPMQCGVVSLGARVVAGMEFAAARS